RLRGSAALPGLVAVGRRCPAAGGAAAPPYRSWFGLKAARQRKPYRVWLRQGGGAPPLAERQLRPTVRLWFEGCAAAQPCRVWLWQGGGAPAAGGAAAPPYRNRVLLAGRWCSALP